MVARLTLRILVLCGICLTSGCASYFEKLKKDSQTIQGADPIVTSFNQIDLATMLDPKGLGQDKAVTGAKDFVLEKSLNGFYDKAYGDDKDQAFRRDRIQGALIAASNKSCEAYQTFLKGAHSGSNFLFGSLTTVFAGAGAIVTGVNSARMLSGTGAILSGVRTELDSDYFNALSIEVITKAIEKGRSDQRDKIQKARTDGSQATSIQKYTVEEAIADAFKYHRACSLIAGLEEASNSISIAQNPGLNDVIAVLQKNNISSPLTTNAEIRTRAQQSIDSSIDFSSASARLTDLKRTAQNNLNDAAAQSAKLAASQVKTNLQSRLSDLNRKISADTTSQQLQAEKTNTDALSQELYALLKTYSQQTAQTGLVEIESKLRAQQSRAADERRKIQTYLTDFSGNIAQPAVNLLTDIKAQVDKESAAAVTPPAPPPAPAPAPAAQPVPAPGAQPAPAAPAAQPVQKPAS